MLVYKTIDFLPYLDQDSRSFNLLAAGGLASVEFLWVQGADATGDDGFACSDIFE